MESFNARSSPGGLRRRGGGRVHHRASIATSLLVHIKSLELPLHVSHSVEKPSPPSSPEGLVKFRVSLHRACAPGTHRETGVLAARRQLAVRARTLIGVTWERSCPPGFASRRRSNGGPSRTASVRKSCAGERPENERVDAALQTSERTLLRKSKIRIRTRILAQSAQDGRSSGSQRVRGANEEQRQQRTSTFQKRSGTIATVVRR